MKIQVIEDPAAKALAEADPTRNNAEELRPKPREKAPILDTSDIFPIDAPILGGEDLGDVTAAGFSVGELSSGGGDETLVEDFEPTVDDLAIEEDLLADDGLTDLI